MVVIAEDLTATAVHLDEHLEKSPLAKDGVLQQCKAALKIMHDNDYCHGDFRTCNIMVRTTTNKVAVLDSIGLGKREFLLIMNHTQIEWPQGATDGALISKHHDKYWLMNSFLTKPSNRNYSELQVDCFCVVLLL